MSDKPNRKIYPPQFQSAEYQRRDMIAQPEPGTTLAEMLNPLYWANVAASLRAWDRIEVRPADGTWWAELIVRVVEPFSVVVHVLRHETFRSAALAALAEVPDGYEVRNRGSRRWCVTRLEDHAILSENHASRDIAMASLATHLRTISIAA